MLKKEYNITREQKITSPKNYATFTNKNGQRVSLKRRGKKRYFCFIQERFGDIYCLLIYSVGMPEFIDNFNKDNLSCVYNNLNEVRSFLISLSNQKQKSITFSVNSIKIS